MLQLVITGAPVIAPPEKTHPFLQGNHTASYHSKAYLYQNGYQYRFCFPVWICLDLILKKDYHHFFARCIQKTHPAHQSPRCLRFIHNGRKKIQSSNDGNVLSHLAKKKQRFHCVRVPICPLEYPQNKTIDSQDSLRRLDSETSVCLAIPGLWKQGLVDTCILIGLAKASQDLLTYDLSRRLEALARAAQELYTV